MELRELCDNEISVALDLSWEVFKAFEAPDYSEQGVQEFYKSIHDANWLSIIKVYGAFEKEDMIGVIATRNMGKHIALFFVKGEYHKQGVGRKLFEQILEEAINEITVNSSPYAVQVYQRLGFNETDIEQEINGIRFIPMKIHL